MMHSKKHILIYALLIIILAGLQEAFFNHLRILGAKPNLTLVAVCIIAVRMTRTEAMVLGFLAGLYVDIVYSRYVGLYAPALPTELQRHTARAVFLKWRSGWGSNPRPLA